MTSILDAHHQCWMQFRPAMVLYSDGEGALNNDAAKAVLKAKGTEMRTRARGQHATTINARFRHLLHAMETAVKRLYILLVFTRLLHEALFAANVFTFCNEVSPRSAMFGRQTTMLPDLSVLDHEQPTETADHSREQVIRRACTEAITEAPAVTTTNLALRIQTTI